MLQKTKLKLVFWGSLISGIGLCIGGIFVPALLVPGGILIAAALAMYQSAYSVAEAADHVEHTLEMVEHAPIQSATPPIEITQNIGLFFMYRPRSDSELTESLPERSSAPTPSRLTLI